MNAFIYRDRHVEILTKSRSSGDCTLTIDGVRIRAIFTSEAVAEYEARLLIDFDIDGALPERDRGESIHGGHWRER